MGEDGCPSIPMEEETILKFLAHAAAIRGKDKQASFSAVNNYVSAIKYAHNDVDMPLSAETSKKISQFLKGYKREVCMRRTIIHPSVLLGDCLASEGRS